MKEFREWLAQFDDDVTVEVLNEQWNGLTRHETFTAQEYTDYYYWPDKKILELGQDD